MKFSKNQEKVHKICARNFKRYFLIKKKDKEMLRYVSYLWATGLGSGYGPYMPGTWGSLVGAGLYWLFMDYFALNISWLFLLTIFISLSGWSAINHILVPERDPDPSIIVIDEIAGIFVTYGLLKILLEAKGLPMSKLWFYGAGFVAFRFFDMLKPFPINVIESYFACSPYAAFGIMIDDILAGIAAALLIYVILIFSN